MFVLITLLLLNQVLNIEGVRFFVFISLRVKVKLCTIKLVMIYEITLHLDRQKDLSNPSVNIEIKKKSFWY